MVPLKKTSRVDLAELAVLDAIQCGRLVGHLPGLRPLSSALGVNHLTLAAAVKRLEAAGWLISEGPRKRFRIAGAKPRKQADLRESVLFLSPKPIAMIPEVMEVVSEFMLKNPDIETHHGIWGEPAGKPDPRRWESVVAAEGARHLVVFSGNPEMAHWVLERRIPTIFIGGHRGDFGVPSMGCSLTHLISRGIERLAALGHTDICLPACGFHPKAAAIVRRQMAAGMEQAGLAFDADRHLLFIQRQDAGMLEDGLRRIFKVRVPTAILLTEPAHFATVAGLLAERRMLVPRDVSVLILLHDGLEEWNVPRIARFTYPVAELAKTLRSWIDHPPADPFIRFHPPVELIEAGSLAPPRRGG